MVVGSVPAEALFFVTPLPYSDGMKTVVLGDTPPAIASMIAERQRLGLDRHDEVWNGEYHMAPMASFEHAESDAALVGLLQPAAAERGLKVTTAFNLGSSPTDFRVPDLGVHRGHPVGVWIPTAAIVVEVRSPDDETFEKFGYYFERGVEEVLVADLVSHEVTWFVRGPVGFASSLESMILGLTSHDVLMALRW